jgi:hypothetical protein
MKLKLCFSFFLYFTFAITYSQTTISGKIRNLSGEILTGAAVTIKKDSTGSILAYGISDDDGEFKIKLNSLQDTVFLKISYMGYSVWQKTIPNINQHYEVRLTESSEILKEIFVESHIINKRGDTLSFRVSAFKGKKDRVIADVLKKMPGIDIMPTGQIFYQGQPIQKYYIEGLDLLEGRYSLANNNISADDVSDVQILENHQSVKVLDSLEFSDKTSINIKLKKSVTTSGNAEFGAGLSPILWKTKITPMLFTKKQQAIVSYQSNNVGNDVSQEIQEFSFSESPGDELDIDRWDWLGIPRISPPPFDQERWLNNNGHLGSANFLIRLKKDIDFKMNVSYLNDTQKQKGSIQTLYFTPLDTLRLIENNRNHLFLNSLKSKFILERNSNERFFKNELEINKDWDWQRGSTLRNEVQIQQKLSNPFIGIRNSLRLITPVRKRLITIDSNIGYTQSNQNLIVSPGQFQELLNNGDPYEEVDQMTTSATFFADNAAGFKKRVNSITVAPEVGFSLMRQQLSSRLALRNNGVMSFLDDPFRNELELISSRFYFSTEFNYKKNDWSWSLYTPVNYRKFKKENDISEIDSEKMRFSFEPSLYLKKVISNNWEGSISAKLNRSFGDFRNIYNGYILNNYRNIQRYNAPIAENFIESYYARLAYSNPLNSFFANTSYNFVKKKSNILYSSEVGEGGAILVEALEQDNSSDSHIFSFENSKHFRSLNSTVKFSSSYSFVNGKFLLNNILADVNNQQLNFNLGMESELTRWLSTSYSGDLSFLESTVAGNKIDEIITQKNVVDLSIFPAENQYFSIESEFYYSNFSSRTQNNYFLNFKYQFSFEKKKIDLEAYWYNVLNADKFFSISNNEFSTVQSVYYMRPSQLMVSVKFIL